MSAQVCNSCTTRYAFGLLACPHCGGTGWLPSWEVDDGGLSPAHQTASVGVVEVASLGGPGPREAAEEVTDDEVTDG